MEFTKYEKARIVGARALQIAMGAPILTSRENELDPIKLAKKEFEEETLPISVKRETPEKVVKEKKIEEKEAEEKSEEAEVASEEKGEENKDKEA